jgi:hypothetical protein
MIADQTAAEIHNTIRSDVKTFTQFDIIAGRAQATCHT